MKKYPSLYRGQMLVIALIFLAVVMILAASLFARTAGFLRFGSRSIGQEQALNLAEAGIERTLWKLNETAGACDDTCDDELTVGTTGSFKVKIQEKNPPNPQLKSLVSTGYVPNSTNPRAKQTIKVDISVNTQGTSFRYAVQTLEGGVTMSQSARINGNVYTNGSILAGVGNGQIITGDAYAVGTIDEEPAGPIDVQGDPVEGAPSQDAPDITSLINNFTAAAVAGETTDCLLTPADCTIDTDGDIGPRKYINGNLEITNNAVVKLMGAVWVAKDDLGNGGNFSMSQGDTTLKLDESFGSNSTGIVVDGGVDLTQGGKLQPTTANPKGYIMIVSGSTANDAVRISQSGATGIFYALQGGGVLSQTASVAALVANRLEMTQSSILNYETGLADARFSTGPGGSWQIKKGTYKFTGSP